MTQLDLFRQEPPAPERRPPDVDFIRKCLLSTLRLMRDAEDMPWHPWDAANQEQQFPLLAAFLPADEAEEYVSEFRSEMARLHIAEAERIRRREEEMARRQSS